MLFRTLLFLTLAANAFAQGKPTTIEIKTLRGQMKYDVEEFQVAPGAKVRLVLTHSRLETTDIVLSVSGGWHTHLNVLEDVLSANALRPFYKMQTQLEAEYSERLGLV